jgi:hypothetical protein
MEAIGSSETLVTTNNTTWHYIAGNYNPDVHWRQNLKSQIFLFLYGLGRIQFGWQTHPIEGNSSMRPWQRECSHRWVDGEHNECPRGRLHLSPCTSQARRVVRLNRIDRSKRVVTVDPWQHFLVRLLSGRYHGAEGSASGRVKLVTFTRVWRVCRGEEAPYDCYLDVACEPLGNEDRSKCSHYKQFDR